MSGPVVIDTGPLVALLNRRDRDHAWAVQTLSRIAPPALTCEPVLAEVCFLLRKLPGAPGKALRLVEAGVIHVGFSVEPELPAVRKLMEKYEDVPMSLADACLVRMAELHRAAAVITLDSDFLRYRMNGRERIPVISPER